ncbi:MAG TPA: YeeE/YedE thiosulfate transporter family protein, partial [Paracoccaceae bacterium]|nr:YeeE/YedE thiosulfate transporter family protein [Paracoccaceae bacterium]
MSIVWLLDTLGEEVTIALAGLVVGTIFGVAAQRSRFCLRAATVEFARGRIGPRTAVWLLTFSTALLWTQGAVVLDVISLDQARMLAIPGSISGAVIGGLIFGVGMVLARGCSGRLLVLAATGNLRAVISGLVFAVVAQMTLHGWLAPLRNWLAGLWVTPNGANIQLTNFLGLPTITGAALGL